MHNAISRTINTSTCTIQVIIMTVQKFIFYFTMLAWVANWITIIDMI